MLRIHLPVLVLLLALAGCRRAASPEAPPGYRFQYDNIMGTYAAMTFWEDEATSRRAAEAVMEVFREVNERFSNYRDDSEIMRLNRSAFREPFACSDSMWQLLGDARHAYRISNGAFDISAGPLMRLWGFHRKRNSVPAPGDIAQARAIVGLDKVVFDDEARTVRFTVEGMELDSGGIAKGYAIDLARERLAEMGIERGLIDLGGNIYCLPGPPPGRPGYTIGVRNPRQREAQLGTVPMLGQAIATSGDYERFVMLEGKRFSHIMDPRTGMPVAGMASVTVVAADAVVTDYLSTAIFVNRGEHMEPILEAHPDIAVLIVTADAEGRLAYRKIGAIWNDIEELPQ